MPSKFPGSQFTSGQIGSQIVTRVRALLNESSASFFSDNQIMEWINNGCLDIVTKTWCLGSTKDITLLNNILEYDLTTNYITIASVHYYDNGTPKKALLRSNPSMFGHVPDPNEPVYWYEFDNKLGIFPIITNAGTQSVKVMLITPPAVIGLANPLPIPQYFDEAIVKYACSMGLFRDNELQTAQSTMEEYSKTIALYSSDLISKPPEEFNDPKGK